MTQPTRRRLSPEARRNQLLDCAAAIILEQGLSSLTMEQLASEAGVSNPLIYKYFDTRLQLLQALLVREYAAFRKSLKRQLTRTDNYRDAVRSYVEINFQQYSGGDVLSILFSQADVRQAIVANERSRHGPFFVQQLAEEYAIDTHLAEQLVVMASGASLAAAEHFGKYGGDRDAQIDQAVDFIFAGIERVLAMRSQG